MKYRNLKLSFNIEETTFTVISISLEKMTVPIPRHSHSRNSFELHYVSYGYGKLMLDDATYDITPGTFFVTGPGVFHEQISEPDDPMTEYGVYLQVEGKGPRNSMVRTFLNTGFWIGNAAPGLHEIMKQIIEELELNPPGYEEMLPSLLKQMILAITRQYMSGTANDTAGEGSASFSKPSDRIYLTIEEAFLYNYMDLTLEKLAATVNLGPRQTERLLKKHYNKTFLQKKTEARMSAACLLLKDRKLSISSVADRLGYSSAEHFCAAFKAYYHLTPSEYRKK